MIRLPLLSLLLLAGAGGAHAAPADDDLEALVGQVTGGDAGRASAARTALFRLGPAALERLRVAASALKDAAARQRALSVWKGLIDRHALAYLRKGPAGRKPSWKLAVRSDLFPYLRCYRAEGKYPQAVILDVERSEELPRVTARAIQDRLRRRAPKKRCRSRKLAAEVARLFVELRQQPYGAGELKLKTRTRGRSVLVTATFTRVLPWDDGRTRTEARRVTVSLDRRCRFRLVSRKTLSVVYSAR